MQNISCHLPIVPDQRWCGPSFDSWLNVSGVPWLAHCRYDRRSGGLASTALGRVASYYYLSHQSMATYNEYLKPTMSDIELFRLFSLRWVATSRNEHVVDWQDMGATLCHQSRSPAGVEGIPHDFLSVARKGSCSIVRADCITANTSRPD